MTGVHEVKLPENQLKHYVEKKRKTWKGDMNDNVSKIHKQLTNTCKICVQTHINMFTVSDNVEIQIRTPLCRHHSWLNGFCREDTRQEGVTGVDMKKITFVHCWWGCKLVSPLQKIIRKLL